jgi:hypothetical protein
MLLRYDLGWVLESEVRAAKNWACLVPSLCPLLGICHGEAVTE